MYNSGQRLKTSDLNFNPCLRSSAREQNILENVAPKFTSEIANKKFACGSKLLGEETGLQRFGKDVWQKQLSPELFEANKNTKIMSTLLANTAYLDSV